MLGAMSVYVALPRAVNVAGTGMLPMKELRELCEAAGFDRVATYIQSGNVVFSSRRGAAAVQRLLEEALAAKMGKPVGVHLRTPDELASIPDGVTVCEWGYEDGHPFAARAALLAAAGRPFWLCPGTSSWNTLVGRWSNMLGNIRGCVDVAVEKVTDYAAIAGYGIASTPGIVVDGKVVHAGGLPKPEDLQRWMAG